MKYNSLLQKCEMFEKLARIEPPATQQQLTNRLREVLRRVASLLPSQYQAEQIFKNIQASKQKNQLELNPYFKEAQRLLTQLEFLEERAPNAAASMGVKPNVIPILKQNLKTLLDGQNFSGYQHYTLLRPGESAPIDLDEWTQKQTQKYDLGF